MRVAIAFNEIFLSGLGTLHIAICIFAWVLAALFITRLPFLAKGKRDFFYYYPTSFVADVVSLFNHQATSDVPIIFLKNQLSAGFLTSCCSLK